ncbi:MAG: hypothetical protein P0121_01395 [Nitrospira sp.]|nr:hypothetical protein [Nitrospira sp.]
MRLDTCSSFKICGVCHTLHGTWRYQHHQLDQHCQCIYRRVRAGLQCAPAPWPVYDFNEVVTLCRCCGAQLLESGSRWSVWFCPECKARVVGLNQRYQRCLIPIGRHSMMNGFRLSGSECRNPSAVEQFVLNVRAMQDSTGLLVDWAAAIVSETARARGFPDGMDVTLLDYAHALEQHPVDKVSAFERLCAYFQNPVTIHT